MGARAGLRQRRLQAGLTRAELARRSGVDRHTITRLERGTAKGAPRASTLAALASALGADVHVLAEEVEHGQEA